MTRQVGEWTFVYVAEQAVGVGSRGDARAPVDTVRVKSGWMLTRELRVDDYCSWLNAEAPENGHAHPQVELVHGEWRPKDRLGAYPLTHVTAAEAERLCAWVGVVTALGGEGRLPTEAEWMVAARAGVTSCPTNGC